MSKAKTDEQYRELAAAVGMTYDSQTGIIYGKKDDFDILIYVENIQYPFVFTIHTAAKSVNGSLMNKNDFKEAKKTIKPIVAFSQKGNQITAVVGNQRNREKRKEALPEAVNGVISFLRSRGYVPCCSMCNESVETVPYMAVGGYYHLCPECSTKMRGNLAMLEQQNAQKTENLAGGIAGALIGSLLGAVCIVLLSQLGYVAAISGVLMAVGVLKGYEKLGGKLTKKGIVISMIIMVFMTYAGDRMDWAIRLLRDAGFGDYGWNLFECYRIVPEAVTEFEIQDSYYGNLVLLYAFLLLGAIPTVVAKVKEKKMASVIRQIGGETSQI